MNSLLFNQAQIPILSIQGNGERMFSYSWAYNKGKWSNEEDQVLTNLVCKDGWRSWKEISNVLKTRNPVQCLHRWTKILKPGLKKGPWTIEEDKKLYSWITSEGPTKWTLCSEFITGRSGKQCRERWFNTWNPILKKGNWTPYEDYQIFSQFRSVGSKWSKIVGYLPGRTENSIKNRFYSTLRRIAGDWLKRKDSLLNQNSNSSTINLSNDVLNLWKNPEKIFNVTNLLVFFDWAYQEKVNEYATYKDNLENEIYLNKPGISWFNNNMSSINLNPTQTFNNPHTTRLSLGCNNSNYSINQEYERLMQEDCLGIEKKIMDYDCEDFVITDDQLDNVEKEINSIIENVSSHTSNYNTKISYIDSPEHSTESDSSDKTNSNLWEKILNLERYLKSEKDKIIKMGCNNASLGYHSFEEESFGAIGMKEEQFNLDNELNMLFKW